MSKHSVTVHSLETSGWGGQTARMSVHANEEGHIEVYASAYKRPTLIVLWNDSIGVSLVQFEDLDWAVDFVTKNQNYIAGIVEVEYNGEEKRVELDSVTKETYILPIDSPLYPKVNSPTTPNAGVAEKLHELAHELAGMNGHPGVVSRLVDMAREIGRK
jgi:hypothetical protein